MNVVNVVVGVLAVSAIFSVIIAIWIYKVTREDEGDGDTD